MHVLFPALIAWALTGGPLRVLDPGDDGSSPTLTLPGGPPIPMPPGAEVFGPGGSTGEFMPTLPGAAPPKAEMPSGGAPKAELTPEQQRKVAVDDLFLRLSKAQSETEATALLTKLDQLLLVSGSATADVLMSRAIEAVGSNDYKIAEDLLTKVVALRPNWAEAWNKRATVRFLEDDDMASMADIGQVLRLEPRHFGALSGMGFILHRNGDDKNALTVFRRAAAINPQSKDVRTLIETLTPEVEGHDL